PLASAARPTIRWVADIEDADLLRRITTQWSKATQSVSKCAALRRSSGANRLHHPEGYPRGRAFSILLDVQPVVGKAGQGSPSQSPPKSSLGRLLILGRLAYCTEALKPTTMATLVTSNIDSHSAIFAPSEVTPESLIHAIVRQTSALIAQLATAEGVRA